MAAEIHFLPTEEKVLEMLQQGDQRGLVHLYKQCRSPVRAYVLRNNGTPDDAEDLLQEAVVVLWERIRDRSYEHSAKMETFVLAVARNIWLRRLHRRKRENPGNGEATAQVADSELSPLETLMQDEDSSRLASSLKELGEPCRTILLLYYYEECSMDEIARRMGFANAETAKSKKYQCKKRLQAILDRM